MSITLGDAILYLKGDRTQLDKDLDETKSTTQTWAQRFGQGIKGALGTAMKVGLAGAVGGLAALGGGLAFLIKEAADGEEVQAQLNAVLKSTGGIAGVTADMANDLATEMSKVTRFEDDVILSGQNMLLTFTKIGKDVFPLATETMLDMSQALGQDMQSSAVQLGKALNDPINGVTALQRVGVTFSEEQKKVIESLVATGDIAGAQTLILQELQTEFGGSATAAGQTLAGQLDILRNAFHATAGSIGEKLLPMVTPLVQGFTDLVLTLMDAGLFSAQFEEALAKLIGEENAGKLMAFFQGIATWWTETAQPALADLGAWLGENIPKVIEFLVGVWLDVLQPALQTVWAFIQDKVIPILQDVWTWIGTNLPPVIEKLAGFWNNTLKPALQGVWSFIQGSVIPILQDVWTWIGTNLPPVIQTLADYWTNTLKPALDGVWAFIQNYVVPVFEKIGELIGVTLQVAVEGMSVLWNTTLKPALETVWKFIDEHILPIFQDLWNFITEKISPVIDGFVNGALEGLRSAFVGIRDAIGWVLEKLGNLLTKLKEWKTPADLVRQSPSPFEMTFLGANAAIEELTKRRLPDLANGMAGLRLGNNYYGSTFELTANYRYQDEQSLASDIRMLQLQYGA